MGQDGKRHSKRSSQLGRGASIGRYLVLGLLGKGGMGEVYAAYDPELDRKIALKLLRAQAGDRADPSEGRARLLREAQAIARLSDPNVVVVFDVGTFEERVFLAMEFVDGHTLGYWLHAQPRSWRDIVKVFQKAGQGLASAHKAGIVHRDFKPENVMISADGQVRVMDFGLARTIAPDEGATTTSGSGEGRRTGNIPITTTSAPPGRKSASVRASLGLAAESVLEKSAVPTVPDVVGADGASLVPGPDRSGVVAAGGPAGREWSAGENATRDLSRATNLPDIGGVQPLDSPLTLSGAMMGTPAYMAPEQFRNGAVDARADQFAFCVALYEALYGERPFKGKSLPELTASVLAGKVNEPPAQTKVPGWLRKVVLRGLRVERNDRHASMDALLAELRKDPAVQHRRWAAVGGVAVVVALLAGGLVRAERQQRTRCLGAEAKLAGIWEVPKAKGALSPRKEAIRKTFLATGKRYAADSFNVVAAALDRYVTDWTKMHRDSCEATNVRGEQSAEVLDLRTSCLNDRFAEARALTNVLAEANGQVVEKAVQAAQSLRPIEQCADIAALKAVVKPPDDPTVRRAVAEVRAALAVVKALANAGRYRKALHDIRPIEASAKALKYLPVEAEVLLQLGELQEAGGDITVAEKALEGAVWLAEASRHDEVALEAATDLIPLVGAHQSRPMEGERWGRYAEALLQRLGPGHELLSAWRANNLAIVFHSVGRTEDALAMFREGLAAKVKVLGEKHYDVAVSMANVAFALFKAGHPEEAITANARALELFASTIGTEHPRQAFALSNGAEFMNTVGRYAEGQVLGERAIALYERESVPDSSDIATPLAAVGFSWLGRGQPQRAIPFLERAIAIWETKSSDRRVVGDARFALARAQWNVGHRSPSVVVLARRALAELQGSGAGQNAIKSVEEWIAQRASGSPQPLAARRSD